MIFDLAWRRNPWINRCKIFGVNKYVGNLTLYSKYHYGSDLSTLVVWAYARNFTLCDFFFCFFLREYGRVNNNSDLEKYSPLTVVTATAYRSSPMEIGQVWPLTESKPLVCIAKNWQSRCRSRVDPQLQISCQSIHVGELLHKYAKYNNFSVTPTRP